MSILIQGMELPKDGYIDVRLFSDGCAYIQTGEHPYYRAFEAIELPPHGRLGDLDALMLRVDCHGTNKFGMLDEDIREFIGCAPAIIPAEEE